MILMSQAKIAAHIVSHEIGDDLSGFHGHLPLTRQFARLKA
jgi:hypothetical protein